MNWIGYIGTAIIIYQLIICMTGSFLINDLIKLRVVNLLGGFIWLIYGISLNDALQIVINAIIIVINSYWFYKNRNKL